VRKRTRLERALLIRRRADFMLQLSPSAAQIANTPDPARQLALGHGLFWIATGLWPVFHMRSFETVTGPKRDHWLVRTVGLLLASMGAGLIAGARDDRGVPASSRLVASAASGAIVGIDLVYTAKRVLKPVYLIDALVHAEFVAAWLVSSSRRTCASGNRQRMLQRHWNG
jgi:hypothetical protein